MLISYDIVFYLVKVQNCTGEKQCLYSSQIKVILYANSLDYLPEDLGHKNKFTSELVITQDLTCIRKVQR